MKKKKYAQFVRNFVFGVEDSLVSTVGVVSGIAVASVPKSTIILTGLIVIFVEAFSMGIGSLLSEHTAEEYISGKELPLQSTFAASAIMFVSYFFAGFIPLAPYVFFNDVSIALPASILSALIALFVLGVVAAKMFQVHVLKHGFQMLIIGGGAVIIGALVGYYLQV